MLKKVFIIFSSILAFPAFSKESKIPKTNTYVFCSPVNARSSWRWAVDTNNNYVTATGYWKTVEREVKIIYGVSYDPFTYVFVINSSEYKRIISYCEKDEFIQPADSFTSSWYAFSVESN
ncbi:hypothetical protein [Fluviispira vulneris]|uniref:hypothetical protein n=1 Tax=Fluviispira vulneris TaxID=2763012 RepID=UPI001648F4CE|nr:hypothetical protein [Fluviispira vulneris]